MVRVAKLLAALGLGLGLALAFAFGAPQTANAQDDNNDEKKKVKNYDFTGDDIDGDLIKPDGDFIDTTDQVDHTSLITIRKDFIQEILKSAEDL